MKKTLIIGTRSSKLALWQTDFVAQKLMAAHTDLVVKTKLVTTKGDKILDAPLAKIGGKGLFTKELETAILSGEIDLAVHSFKDMPTEITQGLAVVAVTERTEPRDALVSNDFASLTDLPDGCVVGTSSLRRKAQLLSIRPDLTVRDLRGNVNTRLKKLDSGEFAAIILAAAGLSRLGFSSRIRELLPTSLILPAVGQGVIAVEGRANDEDLLALTACLMNENAFSATRAERGFLAKVGGGCQVPVGAYATVAEGDISLSAVIASPDGKNVYRGNIKGSVKDGAALGEELANKLLSDGGRAVLRELGL